jgi:excisionase family DNA binding protein
MGEVPGMKEQKSGKGVEVHFELPVDSHTAAASIGIHYKTLERLARKGKVPATKQGKAWQYRLSALSAWFDDQLKSNMTKNSIPTKKKENGE